MLSSRISASLLLVLCVSACAVEPSVPSIPSAPSIKPALSAADELQNFRAAIRAKYDMKEAAFAANDIEPIITRFYTDDAISTGPDGTTKIGRAELRPVYEEVIGGDVKIESFNTVVEGNTGWDWVNFYVTPPAEAGEAPFSFKMLFLWQRIDGEWWSQGEMYVVGRFNIE